MLFPRLHDEWDQDDGQNTDDQERKDDGHMQVLASHLLPEVGTLLLEDAGLLVELVGPLGQALGLLGVLEHGADVVLHLDLDLVDLADEGGGLVDLGEVVVLLAHGLKDGLGLFGEGVGRGRLGLEAELLGVLAVQLDEGLDGDAGGVLESGNDGEACGLKCGPGRREAVVQADEVKEGQGQDEAKEVCGNEM